MNYCSHIVYFLFVDKSVDWSGYVPDKVILLHHGNWPQAVILLQLGQVAQSASQNEDLMNLNNSKFIFKVYQNMMNEPNA